MSSGPVKPASARPNAVSPVTVAHGIPSFTVLPVSLLYPEEPAAAWFGALTPEMSNAWASRSGGERRSQPAAATAPYPHHVPDEYAPRAERSRAAATRTATSYPTAIAAS